MEALTISLTTFLKISASRPRTKLRELRTFTQPGGYDFYKVMKKIAAGLAGGKIDFDEASHQIAQIKQAPERKHTLEAITKFYAWLITQKHFRWHPPPKGNFKSTSGLVTIRLTPELGYADDTGTIRGLHLWNLNKPELKNELAGEGVRLLIDHLARTHEYGIFNLRNNKILGQEIITGATDAELQLDLMIVEMIWKDLHDSALSTEDMVEHIASFKSPPP